MMNVGDFLSISEQGEFLSKYAKRPFNSSGFSEKWLQKVIFENIELIKPTDPVYEKIRVIPLCREFSLNDGVRNLFVDILAVTETGRIILIECKLWKNPQARREVLAQAFEYASNMQSLSYSDLSAKLKSSISSGHEDPLIYALQKSKIDVDQVLFINRVDQSLKKGNFHIIIAGDGIRSDLANLVNSPVLQTMTADLSLLEIAIHQNEENGILLYPSTPARVETLTRTVLISPEGMPVQIEEDVGEPQIESKITSGRGPMNENTKELNSIFWNNAIKRIEFDHPDQEPLRKGGNNWCKALLPYPLNWITAYRTKNSIGVFLRITGEDVARYQEFFEGQLDILKNEISPDVRLQTPDAASNKWSSAFFIVVTYKDIDTLDPKNEEFQIDWLKIHLNKFVNYLRPLIVNLPK